MMRVTGAAAMLLALMVPVSVAAADTSPKLDVQPAEVVFDMGTASRAPVVVLLHNPAHLSIARAKVDLIAPAGVDAKIMRSPLLPSSGDLMWRIDVAGTGEAPSPSKLVVLATYATSRTGPAAAAVAASTLAITLQPPVAAAGALKATLLPSEGTVDELNPLDVRLQIESTARRAIDVDSVELLAPAYVQFVGKTQVHAALPPGGTLSIPLRLTAKTAVPGVYALVVGFRARYHGTTVRASGAAQGKITVGIPGAGEAMQFLGIPSLLLLPGILAIIAFTTTFALLMRRTATDWKQPGLLLIAIVLSFFAALIYPVITGLILGMAHDYLHGYDLRDVIYLWIGSIGTGFAAAVIVAVISWFVARRSDTHKRQFDPNPHDTQIEVLRKLQRNKVPGFRLQQQHRSDGTRPNETLLQLPFGPTEPGMRWLVPGATCKHKDETHAAKARERAVQQALIALEDACNAVGANGADAARRDAESALLRQVEEGLKNNEIELGWCRRDDGGPRQTAEYEPVNGQVAFLEVL